MTLNSLGAHCILPFSLVVSVTVAIEFNNQASAEANEVPYVVPKYMLPSKFVAAHLPPAKARPQAFLRLIRVPAQFPCPLCVDRIATHLSMVAANLERRNWLYILL